MCRQGRHGTKVQAGVHLASPHRWPRAAQRSSPPTEAPRRRQRPLVSTTKTWTPALPNLLLRPRNQHQLPSTRLTPTRIFPKAPAVPRNLSAPPSLPYPRGASTPAGTRPCPHPRHQEPTVPTRSPGAPSPTAPTCSSARTRTSNSPRTAAVAVAVRPGPRWPWYRTAPTRRGGPFLAGYLGWR
jgi:hypothetical protein